MMGTVILVVEDESLLRLNAVDMFVDAGYTVLEAANADEAILILEQRADIRVVFTDVNMPGSMDGLKLVQAIRKRWPPVLLLVTSGKLALRDGDLPVGGRFISKPYSNEQVLSVVAQLAA
jgi:two-component system, response regulator PdtaR